MQTTKAGIRPATPSSTTTVDVVGAGSCPSLPTLGLNEDPASGCGAREDVGTGLWTLTVPLIDFEEASTEFQLPGPIGLRQAA